MTNSVVAITFADEKAVDRVAWLVVDKVLYLCQVKARGASKSKAGELADTILYDAEAKQILDEMREQRHELLDKYPHLKETVSTVVYEIFTDRAEPAGSRTELSKALDADERLVLVRGGGVMKALGTTLASLRWR